MTTILSQEFKNWGRLRNRSAPLADLVKSGRARGEKVSQRAALARLGSITPPYRTGPRPDTPRPRFGAFATPNWADAPPRGARQQGAPLTA